MSGNTFMKSNVIAVAVTVGLVLLATGFAGPASAGCSEFDARKLIVLTAGHEWISQDRVAFMPATYLRVSDQGDDRAVIVGLWKFAFTAKGNKGIPDGAPIDAGLVTWHADGTELMNSSRPPMTQSFCMGVWRQTGHSTFKLNHVALGWDPTGSVFVGPASIREEVTVDSTGNSYAGTFTIDQYAIDEQTVLAHVTGTIAAKRLTAD
jgi:hypothetical protein